MSSFPHLVASAMLLSASLSANAQTVVEDYIPGLTPEGITYFLPETHIRFVLTATRHVHTAGEYAVFAERYLGITDAPMENFENWTLDDIEVIPFGVPDKTKAFTIALNPKSSAPLVTLTPDGLLLAINTETEQPEELPVPSKTIVSKPTVNAKEFLTPDIICASTRSKKAELTAQEIYDIRENRILLAKGQADFNPTDGEQLKAMFHQLDAAEQALLSLFTGTETVERHTMVVDYCPKTSDNGGLLFRFSKYLGLVDIDDMAGEPYTLEVKNTTKLPDENIDPKAAKKKEKPDVRYCIPGRAQLTLLHNGTTIAKADVSIAQFGNTEHLGGELFNKKFNTEVFLNSVTGNIEKIRNSAMPE